VKVLVVVVVEEEDEEEKRKSTTDLLSQMVSVSFKCTTPSLSWKSLKPV